MIGNTAWGEQFLDHHYSIHCIHTEICSLKCHVVNFHTQMSSSQSGALYGIYVPVNDVSEIKGVSAEDE